MFAQPKTKTLLSAEIVESQARRFWLTVICVILGSNIGMGIFAIYLATSDPSQAVIPNYYRKGLEWDKTKAILSNSENLGWSIHVAISPDTDNASYRTIRLTVLGRDGKTIEKASGNLLLFHHAHAMQLQELALTEIYSGVYECHAQMAASGNWDMTLQLVQGVNEFRWQQVRFFEWKSPTLDGTNL
jgi:nitrogen fixation protein FixH